MSEEKKPQLHAVRREPDALMAQIDRALATWPLPGQGAGEGERQAAATAARATSDARPDADDPDLLAPPLPGTRDEGAGRARLRPWAAAAGVIVAAAAMAAGIGVVVHLGSKGDAPSGSLASAGSGASPAARESNSGPGPAKGAWQNAGTPAAGGTDVPGVDPATLPQARADRASPARSVAVPRAATPARPAGAPGSDAVDPQAVAVAPEAVATDDTLRPAGGVAPGSGIRGDPSSLPRRPAFGAVQAAVGAVLPAARACLQPSDPAYRVTVTFQSSGTVRDVGLPDMDPGEAACIRGALARASLPAFAEPTFAAPVTVRPGTR